MNTLHKGDDDDEEEEDDDNNPNVEARERPAGTIERFNDFLT